MVEKIIEFSIRMRWYVVFTAAVVAAFGVYSFSRLPIDAVPDITNVQVQINTEAQGFSPLEVEQRITLPIETAMAGLPSLNYTRSISRYALSQITVIFQDGTDIYFARRVISERLQEIKGKLPPGIDPKMGPVATGLGEVFFYTVEVESGARKPDGTAYSIEDLRTIQDWVIRPQLRNVKGVDDVNSIGGYVKQFHVKPYPDKMIAYGFDFRDIIGALEKNNSNIGAGYIEKNGEQYLIRAPGQVSGIEDIRAIMIGSRDGVPVRIGDVADVALGKELRTGAATKDGKESVIGTVFMRMGENSRIVSQLIAEKMKEINSTLPAGIVAKTSYDRASLVDATIATVKKNLFEGAALVIAVLFLLLGNFRAAIITALIIPLSFLFTVTTMVGGKISGNLLSLGALDFGIIVDGAVVIVDNCLRRLDGVRKELGRPLTLRERIDTVFDASREVRRAIIFGQLIIMIVYFPILTLTGIEGKMFKPMAFTVVSALFGAMIFSLTLVPAAAAIFLTGKAAEKGNRLVSWMSGLYLLSLRTALQKRSLVLTFAGIIFPLSILLASGMGREFLPSLDEGDVTIHALRIPGTSLTQAIGMQHLLEEKLKELPEVEEVFAKIGTADIATDPMPPSVADVYVMLKPRKLWSASGMTKADIVRKIEEKLKDAPGNRYEFTQPIQMRFNELIAGIRSDVAVKLFGDDMETLAGVGHEIEEALADIRGASDVKMEQTTGLPFLNIVIDRNEAARYGLNVYDVQEIIEIAIGGKSAGEVFEGDRRFEIIVRLSDEARENLEVLKKIPIALPVNGGELKNPKQFGYIPLGTVAEFVQMIGPNQISRENGKRVVIVTSNVRGRDIGSFVEEAEEAIKDKVAVPAGYWTDWGGQFEQMVSAANRLKVVIPLALLLIFLLLFTLFGSVGEALLVFSGVPFALTGGVLSLWLRGIPLSISAGVGFIALSGVAVLNGIVMLSLIRSLRSQGVPVEQALIDGSLARFRPVLMTALVAALGFVPMATATGIGAEVQRPLATVVIGGIISSTALTLIVLPVLYSIFIGEERK